MGRTEFLTWKRLRGEPWLAEQKQKQKLQRERNGARRSARISAPQKYLTPPTFLETPVTTIIVLGLAPLVLFGRITGEHRDCTGSSQLNRLFRRF